MEPPDTEQRAARTRKLYRYISEAIRKVDESTSRSKSVLDLFASSLEIHRQKLRENCEKLIFADPLLYGRKAQELLWRKGYYEAVSAAKRLRAINTSHDELVLSHIHSGIGHYHNLISRIQIEMNVDMTDLLDYPLMDVELKSDDSKTSRQVESTKWAKSSIQICLVYLGDLSRYKTEFEDDNDNSMSVRYYLQASGVDPKAGMPFNQLGTLHTGKHHCLDSVRYYIVCLSCENPFDGAEGNLSRIFDKNNKYLEFISSKQSDGFDQQETIKNFICKFISLVDCWFNEKDAANLNDMCTSTLYELKECLQYAQLSKPDKNMCQADYMKLIRQQELNPDYLSCKIINKIVLIILLCMDKLQREKSSQLFSLKAFALALLSQLLQKLLSTLTDIGFEVQSPEEIIEERKEKMKNYKNMKNSLKDNLQNGHETVLDVDDKQTDEDKSIPTAEIPNLDETELFPKEIVEESIEMKSDENKIIDNKFLENDKLVKAKAKKSTLKRRRRRRFNSLDSCEDSESEVSTDGSDLEDNKLDDVGSESENDGSDDSFYTYTSSEEDNDDVPNNNDEVTKDKLNSTTSSENENGFTSHENFYQDSNHSSGNEHLPNANYKKKKDHNVKREGSNCTADKKAFNEELLKEFLENDNLLLAVKMFLSWLHSEAEFLISCRFNGRALFQTMVDILNIVNRQIFPRLARNSYNADQQYDLSLYSFHEVILTLKYKYKTMPLPEDYDMKSTELFNTGLKDLNWINHKKHNLTSCENSAIRFLRLIDFGVFIVKLKIGIIFNRRLKMYTFKRNKMSKRSLPSTKKFNKEPRHLQSKTLKQSTEQNVNIGAQSEGLMRNLGKLWLSAQVRELESEVRAGRHQHGLPAYVVVDAEALSKHTYLVKRLVSSKKLIVLIPTIVLQLMDELKKESGGARSAIRWLEFQLRNGSRFLRTQRSTENVSIPNIKYPKKMAREMHNFIQIIEFCYFFISQENNPVLKDSDCENLSNSNISVESGSNEAESLDNFKTKSSDADYSNILVLLTGSKQSEMPESSDVSCIGLAKMAGVSIENIQDFCMKMKNLFGKSGKNR